MTPPCPVSPESRVAALGRRLVHGAVARRCASACLLAALACGVVAQEQARRADERDAARQARARERERAALRLEVERLHAARRESEARLREARRKEDERQGLLARVRQVDELLDRIEALAEQRDVEALIEEFTRLRELVVLAEPWVDKETLTRWWRRMEGWGECSLGKMRFQVLISRGNLALRTMADAIRRDDWDVVEVGHMAARGIVAEMRLEQREIFHRNADALLARADALADRARVLRGAAQALARTRAAVSAASLATSPSDTPR